MFKTYVIMFMKPCNEPSIVDLLKDILEAASYRPIGAVKWTDAVDAIGTQNPSLILLDLKMPTIDGPSLLEFMRKEGVQIPVIIVSGFITDEVSDDLKKLDVEAFVQKPFRAADILAHVERVIGPPSEPSSSEDAAAPTASSGTDTTSMTDFLTSTETTDGPSETQVPPSRAMKPTCSPRSAKSARVHPHRRHLLHRHHPEATTPPTYSVRSSGTTKMPPQNRPRRRRFLKTRRRPNQQPHPTHPSHQKSPKRRKPPSHLEQHLHQLLPLRLPRTRGFPTRWSVAQVDRMAKHTGAGSVIAKCIDRRVVEDLRDATSCFSAVSSSPASSSRALWP